MRWPHSVDLGSAFWVALGLKLDLWADLMNVFPGVQTSGRDTQLHDTPHWTRAFLKMLNVCCHLAAHWGSVAIWSCSRLPSLGKNINYQMTSKEVCVLTETRLPGPMCRCSNKDFSRCGREIACRENDFSEKKKGGNLFKVFARTCVNEGGVLSLNWLLSCTTFF